MRNVALILAGLVVIVAGFVVERGADDSADESPAPASRTAAATTSSPGRTTEVGAVTEPAPAPKAPLIVVRDNRPEGGVQRLEFEKGDQVRFTVRSNRVDHVHVHGFDVMRDVGPGRPARFSFEATFDGRFEVELEEAGVAIAELRVSP
jgi:hypothetical protein